MRNRIRKLRQELQMTQEELAQRCRVSRQGKYDPSIHLAHRIATIFQHHIEDVFLFTEGADES